MFRIQKAIRTQIYMFAQFTQYEFIGFICMLGIPQILEQHVHRSLNFPFTLFLIAVYIYMCLPIGFKDKKRYHAYLSMLKNKGDELTSYVEDKRTYHTHQK